MAEVIINCVLGIICILASCLILFLSIKDKELSLGIMGAGMLSLSITLVVSTFKAHEKYVLEQYKEIPAIEVYRGNTDLLITYNDTIPVDSTVVLKKK